jgi:chromosome segregation ATPase
MPEPDGKNGEEKAAQEKNDKKDAERIAALEEEVQKQKGIAENAEALVKKWSAEIGDFRKEAATLKETIADLQKAVGEAGIKGGQTEETVEEIEKALTPEQRKVAETVFAQLSEEEKITFADDPKFRKNFLIRTRETVKPVPVTPWITQQKPTPKTPDALDKRIQDLFEKQKRRSAALPTGPSKDQHAATGEGGARAERPKRSLIGESVLGSR